MIQTHDYLDVQSRAGELGFALTGNFIILPANFPDAKAPKLIYYRNEATLRKIWQEAGLNVQTLFKDGTERPVQIQEALEWIVPSLYLAAQFVKDNPELVKQAFVILADYLTQKAGNQKVKFNIVTSESKGTKFRMLSYEGTPEGVKELPKVIREIVGE